MKFFDPSKREPCPHLYTRAITHWDAKVWQDHLEAERYVEGIKEIRHQNGIGLKEGMEVAHHYARLTRANPVASVREIEQAFNKTLRITKFKDGSYKIESIVTLATTDDETLVWEIINREALNSNHGPTA
jgi:hypothetical protein